MTLEPDVLATRGGSVPGEAAVEGEKRLCLALLRDALEVALGRVPASPRERDDALGWIRSNQDSPFGFERVCSELRLDADTIRRRVEKQLAATTPPLVSESGQAEPVLSVRREASPPVHPPVARTRRLRRPRRELCPACGAPLHGPWREKLERDVPLGQDVLAVGTVTFQLCTGCVTFFVEGRFVGEVRFGPRP